ncbi:MAG: MmcB family DNA repair protein [Bacillota bacterium]
MAKQKVRADQILRHIAKKHQGRIPEAFFTEVKNGPTITSNNLLIMDAIAIKKSWTKPCITGYEIKVDRQDFLRDEKWPAYRQYCHRLYFACPTELILPEELPDDIGLIYYNPEKDCINTKRKAVFRDIEIPWEMLYYLVISRLETDRHPFFSNTREFLEAWVKDKEDRKYLGYEVSNKMTATIDELSKKIHDLELQLKCRDEEINLFNKIKRILKQHGLRTSFWGIEEDLRAALSSGGMPPRAVEILKNIAQQANQLIGELEQSEVSA